MKKLMFFISLMALFFVAAMPIRGNTQKHNTSDVQMFNCSDVQLQMMDIQVSAYFMQNHDFETFKTQSLVDIGQNAIAAPMETDFGELEIKYDNNYSQFNKYPKKLNNVQSNLSFSNKIYLKLAKYNKGLFCGGQGDN
jgi:hypothetical protein